MSKVDPWVVLKFGGTSVAGRQQWDTIESILRDHRQRGMRPLVVCSAMSGVSNMLERIIDLASTGRHEPELNRLFAMHRELAAALEVDDKKVLEPYFKSLRRLTSGAALIGEVSVRLHARLMAHGELMLTKLGAAFLTQRGLTAAWLDARDLLTATETTHQGLRRHYLSASCCYDPDADLRSQLDQRPEAVVLTQGFIARRADGETVLLGRGGSDTSASYLAAKVGAERCEIWTDVPGVYTANPQQIPIARLLLRLDFEEAQEITSMGAKVLHPRCLAPLRTASIPLHIRCTEFPELDGTVIRNRGRTEEARVKAISSNPNITLISMESIGMWQEVGYLADVFACFKKHGLSIDLVSTSETNITVSLDNLSNAMHPETLDALTRELETFCEVKRIGPCASVSIVGQNIRTILHQLGEAMEVFEEARVHLVSQAANDLNLTFVVDEDQAGRLVDRLHQLLVEQQLAGDLLGPSWREVFEHHIPKIESALPQWWRERRDELLALAAERSPLYVYDEQGLTDTARRLLDLQAVSRVFYSVKANWHPPILRLFEKMGLGFETVSIHEVRHVLDLFPELDPERVLFTPNFVPRVEYEQAFAAGVRVTLDNLYPLAQWPEVFAGRDIFVRIDPGQGRGHHDFVKTAGEQSKFGIGLDLIDDLRRLIAEHNVRVVGLHAHTGSGILTPGNWRHTAGVLGEVAERLPDVRVLDLGGGLGVVERPGQRPLDLAAVDAQLAEIKKALPDQELWMEPGRYLVAAAGVLLTRVTQIKSKNDFHYVGVDAGMHTMIRPMLYGAYHEIVNLTRANGDERIRVNVVGPICESGDVLGHERRLPPVTDGDVLAVLTAGAYGRVMSSTYNLRPPAEEHLLPPR